MNKTLKIFVFLLIAGLLGGFAIYKYVNKSVTDFANEKPTITSTFDELISKTENDTLALNGMKNKLIAVNGIIKKMHQETTATTLEIGDSISESSIICQMDSRYLKEFTSLKENQAISIKGILSDYSIDTELGLGNTINLNFCTLNK